MDEASPFNAATWLVDRHVDAGAGDRLAYLCAGDAWTHTDLQRHIRSTARGLINIGVEPGDRVVMIVTDELAFPAFFLGALLIGAIAVPVSTMLRVDDLTALVQDAEARAVVVSARYAAYLPDLVAASPTLAVAVVTGPADPALAIPTAVSLHRWIDWTDDAEVAPAATAAADPGFWLYTSGTTGQSKAAIHRHGSIRAVCETYGRTVLGIGPDDRCYSVPKLFFAFGLGNSLFFPLAAGASAVIDPEPPDPVRTSELLQAHRPTLFFAPPGFCAAMADSGVQADSLESVRATVTAGETLPAEIMRRFTGRFGTEMLDGIGSTEALHIFCSNHPGDVRPGWTGRPVEGYQLKLLAEDGSEIAAPDTSGALWVRGDSVAAGYWDRPELTAATFVDGWLRTGDVYERSVDGYYRFIGRNSDMIKAGGIWVSPAEVESVLVEHEDVLEAAVVGGRTPDGLEMTVAFVVPARGRTIDPAQIEEHCRARMAGFKRPRVIHVVDQLPRTATGKIQRFALRAALTDRDTA